MSSSTPVNNDADTVLRLGKSGYPDTLDPAVTNSRQAWTITNTAYQRLFRYVDGSQKTEQDIEGEIAKEWTYHEDTQHLIVNLKLNQFFADGTPVDANAVVFSLNRSKQIDMVAAGDLSMIKSVHALNPVTVKIQLHHHFPSILAVLTSNGSSIINPRVLAYEHDNDLGRHYLTKHTLGSGAFQVEEANERNLLLNANPYYPETLFFNAIDIQIVPKSKKRIELLIKRQLDIIEDLTPSDIAQLKKNERVQVVDQLSNLTTCVFVNTQNEFLKDISTRQRLAQCIDGERIINDIFEGQARIINRPSVNPDGETVAPSQASKLKTKEPKTANNDVTKLTYLSDYPGKESHWNRIGEQLQKDFQRLNIDLKIEKTTFEDMKLRIQNCEFDISVGDWIPSYNAPAALIESLYRPEKATYKASRKSPSDIQLNDLFKQAEACSNVNERQQLYLQTQDLARKDIPYLLMVQRKYLCAMDSTLKGYKFHAFDWQLWNFAKLHR